MTKSLLIVSADTKFSQVLLHGLEQEGYRVQIAKGKGESVVRADEENSSTALLDMDLGYRSVLEIGQALRMLNPEMRLIIFSSEGTPPTLDELHPWMYSPKPYFLPDVLNMLNDSSRSSSKSPYRSAPQPEVETSTGSTLPWLQDVTKAAQHLTRLTLESSAQAALITRGDNLWAYAGQLSQGAAKELAVAVTRHWDGQKGSDLLRFVRLEATKAEHMLYATRLADDVVLALVFDAETPFSTIRSQAGQLVTRLSAQSTEVAEPPVVQKPRPASYETPTEFLEDESNSDLDIPSIADILSDVPPPRPEPGVRPREVEEGFVQPSPPSSRSRQYSHESSPAMRPSNSNFVVTNQENDQTVEHVVEDLDTTMPSKSRPRPETPIRRPMPGELDETRPHSITEVAGRVMLEPISPGLYNLTYACLLVPRFSSHYLTGDMSDRLSEWIPQICIAFGWRLEYMAVRPEYVQWVLNVPPATSPGYLMRIIRQQTSEKIFTEFPKLKKENPSGDFWAPGYLIMGGTQPHPPQLVKDYIKQTRTRQGYSQPSRR
jgi:REP element-mobilizing transposase RayT/CheY-like chemotaxis protein